MYVVYTGEREYVYVLCSFNCTLYNIRGTFPIGLYNVLSRVGWLWSVI